MCNNCYCIACLRSSCHEPIFIFFHPVMTVLLYGFMLPGGCTAIECAIGNIPTDSLTGVAYLAFWYCQFANWQQWTVSEIRQRLQCWHSCAFASQIYFQIITNKMQRFLFIYFYRCCTCFRQFLSQSSGANNCTYSFRYCQTILLLTATMDEMELIHLIHGSSKQQ